jgi:hypothetical protein
VEKLKEFYEWIKQEGRSIEKEEDPASCVEAVIDKMEEMFSELGESEATFVTTEITSGDLMIDPNNNEYIADDNLVFRQGTDDDSGATYIVVNNDGSFNF